MSRHFEGHGDDDKDCAGDDVVDGDLDEDAADDDDDDARDDDANNLQEQQQQQWDTPVLYELHSF